MVTSFSDEPSFLTPSLGMTICAKLSPPGLGNCPEDPAFVVLSNNARKNSDIGYSQPVKVPLASGGAARPRMAECTRCPTQAATISTLSIQLVQAHAKILELQKQLEESQQKLASAEAGQSKKEELSQALTRRPSTPPTPTLPPNKLINMNCNVHVPELIRLAEKGDKVAVQGLLEQGEDSNAADDMGLTALHGAAKKGHKHVVSLLLSHGADPNICSSLKGERPLHYACKYGHAEVVELLLDSGALPDVTSSQNKTPMNYAKEKKHKTIEVLLQKVLEKSQGRAPAAA